MRFQLSSVHCFRNSKLFILLANHKNSWNFAFLHSGASGEVFAGSVISSYIDQTALAASWFGFTIGIYLFCNDNDINKVLNFDPYNVGLS